MSKKEIFLIIIIIAIALVRFFFFIPEKTDFDSVVGEEVYFMGQVIYPPDVRLNNQRVTVRPNNIESNILVILPRSSKVSYGDIVKVKGILQTPENFITNVGKEFNYKRYLANQDIYYILQKSSVEVISSGNGNKIKSILFKIRDNFMVNIEKIISPPKSDLANGLILGARGGFDEEIREEFINTGTIHIVALSGYNVTIVAEGVMKFFGLFLSKILSIFFGILVIFLFIIMTGASSTAVRAGIMATILLFARLTGRIYDAGRALVIAALLMIAYDIRTITDISFQLSFLATVGILFITPKVILWLKFIPIRFKIRELVATTISATISVLPILLYTTGIFSIVSLPSNILILPVIPFAMLFSFITGFLGFVFTTLSLSFGYISHLLLSYILNVIHIFSSLPFASVHTKTFPLFLVILLYIGLIWWVFRKN